MGVRRVLITNNTLTLAAGTERFVRDLTLALLARGFEVAAYSPCLGRPAEELRAAGAEVVDDLTRLAVPDVIHGQHHLETMAAILRFPGVPALYFSHGWLPWEERAPAHPAVVRYAAVDTPTRLAVARATGVAADAVALLPNAVDLERFRPRPALPARPARALLLCNYVTWDHVEPVQRACSARGIELDAFGDGLGRRIEDPESRYPAYDLVLGKGRTVLEAAATGCAVILCGTFGAGPLVRTTNMRSLRTLEGDYRSLCRELTAAHVGEEIDRYDPRDAAEVTAWVREVAGLEGRVDAIIRLYEEAVAAHRGRDEDAERVAAANYLRWLSREHKAGSSPQGGLMTARRLILQVAGRLRRWRGGSA